jgi:PAS domain S-box-containing protein
MNTSTKASGKGKTPRFGLSWRLLLYGVVMVVLSMVVLEVLQYSIFGLPDEFVKDHFWYVCIFMLFLLGPQFWFLRRAVLRPIAYLVEAHRRSFSENKMPELIPATEIPANEVGEIMHSCNDVIQELDRRQELLAERMKLLALGTDVGRALTRGGSLNEALQQSAEAVVRHLHAAFARIWILDPVSSVLELQASAGMYTHLNGPHGRIPLNACLQIAHIARTKQPYLTNTVPVDPLVSDKEWAAKEGMIAFAGCPLIVNERLVGVLGMFARQPQSETALNALVSVSDGIAVRINQHQAQGALAQSEARYRTLAEAAHDMIFIIDRDDRVQYVNGFAAKQLGGTSDQVIGKRRADLFPPEQARRQQQHLEKVFTSGEPQYVEEDLTFPHGSVSLSTQLVPLRDGGDSVTAVLGISRDMSAQKRLERQLIQAQKMEAIGTLAGGIAHDFNNMLTGMIGHAELALAKESGDTGWRDHVVQIPNLGTRAATLIAQLLAFSRKSVVERKPLQLLPLVKETIKMLERTLPENIAIRLNVSEEPSAIMADATQIQQVIMNLCVNAGHAMPNGGELTVGLHNVVLDEDYCRRYSQTRPGRHLCVSIHDTGHGMTTAVQQRLFEPFFTTKPQGQGTGLGLAMVYGIVKSHEGHINVYSEVGCGSEFKIYLPAMESGAAVPAAPPAPVASLNGAETLLLVEDEPAVREVIQMTLEELGYTVISAADGEDGLAIYRKRHREIALVLTDMVMPKMGGRQLHQEMTVINPNVKTLLMSGYSVIQDMDILRARGVAGYVQKPFRRDDLARTIRTALDS